MRWLAPPSTDDARHRDLAPRNRSGANQDFLQDVGLLAQRDGFGDLSDFRAGFCELALNQLEREKRLSTGSPSLAIESDDRPKFCMFALVLVGVQLPMP